MAIHCGAQCYQCDYPINMDTYKGCSHGCIYCFVKGKYAIENIKPIDTTRSLKSFINGNRNKETRWCDWNIPIHWGCNSDPFQKCELEHKTSLDCLKIFAETKYPFIVCTKNPVMLTKEPYLSLIKECRCVLQISMSCSKTDKLERGAPTYAERLKAAEFLSNKVTRVIARVRPYFPDCHEDIIKEIPNYANSGIFGVSVSSYVSGKKQKGMIKIGHNYYFSNDFLFPKYCEIKEKCHENNLMFFCAEDALDFLGDDLSCCGTYGLPDFKPHTYNVAHLAYDDNPPIPTESMHRSNTWHPFKCIGQTTAFSNKIKGKSFVELVEQLGRERIENMINERDKWEV